MKLDRLQLSYLATLAAVGILIISFFVWHFSRDGGPFWVILLVQTAPLVVFIPGLLQHHVRSFLWLCFVILLYFIQGVLSTMQPSADILDWITLLMSIVIFISAMFTARWLKPPRKKRTQHTHT